MGKSPLKEFFDQIIRTKCRNHTAIEIETFLKEDRCQHPSRVRVIWCQFILGGWCVIRITPQTGGENLFKSSLALLPGSYSVDPNVHFTLALRPHVGLAVIQRELNYALKMLLSKDLSPSTPKLKALIDRTLYEALARHIERACRSRNIDAILALAIQKDLPSIPSHPATENQADRAPASHKQGAASRK